MLRGLVSGRRWTLLVRKLKRREAAIGVTIVAPFVTDEGWQFGGFDGCEPDATNGARQIHEIYIKADPGYRGRATVLPP